MRGAMDFLRQRGGVVLHVFPTHVLIAEIPQSLRDRLVGNVGIEQVLYSVVDPSTVASYGEPAMIGVQAWNNNYMGMPTSKDLEATGFTSPGPIVNDTRIAPKPSDTRVQASGAPYGAGFYDTSEYLIGDVAVAIILPESNGAIDPNQENWASNDISSVVGEIQAGMSWWAAREPRAHLSFTYSVSIVSTSYEPIRRSSNDEGLWIGEVMQNMGYTSGDYYYRVRSYLNSVRNTYGTDWAISIFVAHSYWDLDGRFADGLFAYAYYGGPFMVMTYDNDEYFLWNMDAVTAHEFGHLFYAVDEYYGAGEPCTERSGYLNIETRNSEYGSCLINVACIMRSDVPPYTSNSICSYTRGQVGWSDSDGDGVLDIVDFYPQNTLNAYGPDPTTNPTPSYSGYASSRATYPNNNPKSLTRNSITINKITGVYFWVEDTNGNTIRPSQLASPTDGQFDSAFENYVFTVNPALTSGTYKIASVAWNSEGLGLVTWDWLTINAPSTVTVTTTRTFTESSTSYLYRTTTTTTASYTSTTTSTSTSVVYTTVTASLGGAGPAGAGASSSMAYPAFMTVLAIMIGHGVTAGRPKRVPKVRAVSSPVQS
jgi:hypothetical protein